MRDIGFRVWRDWVMCEYYKKRYIVNNWIFFEESNCKDTTKIGDWRQILMQYIWVKDKNWNEIYEWDIVYSEKLGWLWEIRWSDLFTGFVRDRWWSGDYTHFICWLERDDDYFDMEVKGNIYENPELLKK